MKKLFTTAIALIFLCAGVFATSINSIGRCGDEAYLATSYLKTNSYYEVRAENTDSVLLRFTVGDVYADSIIKLKLPPQVVVEMRRRYATDTSWGDWIKQTYTIYDIIEGCVSLPITIFNTDAKIMGNDIKIKFSGSKDVRGYNILGSTDGINFKIIDTLKPNSTGNYETVIRSYALGILGATSILLILGGLARKRKYFMLVLIGVIVLVSCSKELIKPEVKSNYKLFQIQELKMDGAKFTTTAFKPHN